MFGPKITTVFRSRWNALLWAGFVLLTAYCSVPSKDETSQAEDVAASLIAAQGGQRHEAGHHANPWAKDPQ